MSYSPFVADSLLSTGNTTTSIIATGATYTGTAELNAYQDVMIAVATDQSGTLYAEFSQDGSNWDTSLSFKYDTSRINPPHVLVKGYRYFRTRFTNTSTSAQTYFRLSTSYGLFNKLTSPINGTLSENYDSTVVRPTDYKYEVAMGKRQGRKLWNKFGYNLDVDASSGFEIIGSFGGNWPTSRIITTADTLSIYSSSSNDALGGSGAHSVLLIGIDENFLYKEEVVILSGTTSAITQNNWLGINRAIVLSSGASDYNEGNITIADSSSIFGIQAQIPSQNSVTQQCIFHTQINHQFLADWVECNVLRVAGGGGTDVRYTVKAFSYSRVTQTRYEVFRHDGSTRVSSGFVFNPSQPFVVGGREVFYFVIDTDTNDTAVNLRFSGIEERVN